MIQISYLRGALTGIAAEKAVLDVAPHIHHIRASDFVLADISVT